MNKNKFYRYLFIIGAVWNFLLAGPQLFNSFFSTSLFSGAALMYVQGFFCAVLLFGVGYFIVGLNINKNHGIVWLGAIGKVLVFGFFLAYYLSGQIPFYLVLVGIGDLIFAVFFFIFLYQYKSIQK
jgi:hypothetical protein